MNALTDTEKAYLAGLIDGEGCITITKHQGEHNRTPVYTAILVVVMTNKDVIERICEICGCGKTFHRAGQQANHCDQYRWSVNSAKDVARLLRDIIPYMIVKQKEAQALIDFLSLPQVPQFGKNHSTPGFYVQQREAYYQRLRDMKTAGKGVREDTPIVEQKPLYSPQLALF